MTDSFVTQCPHCQTSFRVNHAQLSVARGVVRCGSCLQVFNAAKQLLEQAGKEAPVPTPAPRETVEPPQPRAISQKQWSAAELDLDSLDLDEELARLEPAGNPADHRVRPGTAKTRSALVAIAPSTTKPPGPTACSANRLPIAPKRPTHWKRWKHSTRSILQSHRSHRASQANPRAPNRRYLWNRWTWMMNRSPRSCA